MQYDQLTWVFQSNNINCKDRSAIKQAVIRLGCNTEDVGIVPFSHEATEPPPIVEGHCVVYGSGGLLNLAGREGWKPGGWDGDRFDTSEVLANFGSLALNGNSKEVSLSNVAVEATANGWEQVFVRPVSESKEFPGTVYMLRELQEWVEKLQSSGYFEEQNSLMLIAPFKKLGREWRAFVVDQKLISISQYAASGAPKRSVDVPGIASEFVSKAIQTFAPAPCFVIDVAEELGADSTNLRVVEFNSMNSSGLYDCDAGEIVSAVSNYVLNLPE